MDYELSYVVNQMELFFREREERGVRGEKERGGREGEKGRRGEEEKERERD